MPEIVACFSQSSNRTSHIVFLPIYKLNPRFTRIRFQCGLQQTKFLHIKNKVPIQELCLMTVAHTNRIENAPDTNIKHKEVCQKNELHYDSND